MKTLAMRFGRMLDADVGAEWRPISVMVQAYVEVFVGASYFFVNELSKLDWELKERWFVDWRHCEDMDGLSVT